MRFLKRQSALLLLGLFLVAGALVSGIVHAQTGATTSDIPVQTEIIIPGSEPIFDSGLLRGKVGDLANYLSIIYNFLISIVGVLAGAFILVGGFQYLTAGGDAARVSGAKQRIGNALIGLVLALSSYVLLNTINPDLVNLKLPEGLKGKVKTEMSYIPFCEDLIAAGVKIQPIVSASESSARVCGILGVILNADGQIGDPKTAGGCIYRGNDCSGPVREAQYLEEYQVCAPFPAFVQNTDEFNDYIFKALGRHKITDTVRPLIAGKEFNDLSTETLATIRNLFLGANLIIEDEQDFRNWIAIIRNVDIKGGRCQTCSGWSVSAVNTPGIGNGKNLPGRAVCDMYKEYVESSAASRPENRVIICDYDPIKRLCASLTFQCEANSSSLSCSNYKEKDTLFVLDPYKMQTIIYGKGYITGLGTYGELGSHPGILSSVCQDNPCGYNQGIGCKESDGLVDGVRAFANSVRYDSDGTWECYNK